MTQLVSEEYFDFGLRLMKKIAIFQDVIKSEPGVTIEESKTFTIVRQRFEKKCS